MHVLKNWNAKRAGGRITVNGVDANTDEPRKLVGVDTITPNPQRKNYFASRVPFVIATDKEGVEHKLLLS